MTTKIWLTEEQGKKANLEEGELFLAHKTSDGWVLEFEDIHPDYMDGHSYYKQEVTPE